MTMKKMEKQIHADIVVIDSGYSSLERNDSIVGGINLSGDVATENFSDLQGHGSCITNIILHDNPNVSVFIIKITNNDDQSVCSYKIFDALSFIKKNIDCKIINISVGTHIIEEADKWVQIISELLEDGSIIISAFDNQGAVSYPAAFENVIGVDETTFVSSDQQITSFYGNTIVNVILTKKFYRVKNHTGKTVLANGTSMACAHMTGLLSNNLTKAKINWDSVVNAIRSVSNSEYFCPLKKEKQDERIAKSIKKAVVFPFNKEMRSIILFSDLLRFPIAGYYDFPIGKSIHKKLSDILPYCSNDCTIESISDLKWNDDFDAVIIGHCREYESITKKPFIRELLQKCIDYGKKAYCFDDVTPELSLFQIENAGNIQFPRVSQDDVPSYRFGKLRQLSKPVLGIFGTSSVQGKFTLQLLVRREMLSRGYRIGQLSTEPSGYLFGMNFVYPMGYASTASLHGAQAVSFLNEAMWEIESSQNPDIIIVGSQSGTVPYSLLNTRQLLFEQYEFIQGTSPDAVILCVNLFDDPSYIERTIHFIESASFAKVIAICVSPLLAPSNRFMRDSNRGIASDEKLVFFSKELQNKLNVPVYRSVFTQINEIIDTIESFFK